MTGIALFLLLVGAVYMFLPSEYDYHSNDEGDEYD